MYEQVAEKYAFEKEMKRFLRQSNPWALRDITSRLLEAAQRDMWNADEDTLKRLRELYAEIGGDLEDRMDRAWLKSVAAQKGEVKTNTGDSIDTSNSRDHSPQIREES
jgi:cobalamin biosynthesis Mg chelatase CobN